VCCFFLLLLFDVLLLFNVLPCILLSEMRDLRVSVRDFCR
jgi:hypothetical protein